MDDRRPLVEVGGSAEVDALWSERVEPFARRFTGVDPPPRTPAVPEEHDRGCPRWREHLGGPSWTYDHIGSTAVPGLRAKRFVDLQLGTRAKSGFFRSTG